MPDIVLEHVTKRWGNFVGVNDVSLEIPDNSFITLLGPSGCGKTTILRMIAGLETPTSGRITIGGQVVFDSNTGINVPPNRRNVGFLFQNYALWPNMTVYENIAFGLRNIRRDGRKLTKKEIGDRVKEVSKVVKIEMFMDRYPAELSGGQQQRVAIARTLAPEPQVLFMDEPLSNLDAKLRLEMRYELQRLHVETKRTFVYVTHDQMEAMTLATKICLLNNGVLHQYDAPMTVYDRPANTFVGDFVGSPSMNFVEAKGLINENGEISLSLWDDYRAVFYPNDPSKIPDAQKREGNFVLGIRPEDIHLETSEGLSVTVYGSMPTGMESTLKLKIGEHLLTAVFFGSRMFSIGEEKKMIVGGNDVLLFNQADGNLICAGTLKFR